MLVGQLLATESCLPEPSEPLRFNGVDDQVLQIHAATLDAIGLARPPKTMH
jgi:hypothetical protein